MTVTRLLARPMMASMFVVGGVNALKNSDQAAQRAKPVTDKMTAAAQKWEFSYVGGYYRIKNLHAAKCLDNLNGSAALNADVGLWSCNGGTAQDWSIVDQGSGWFSLRNRASGLCLDNYEWNTANGARLVAFAMPSVGVSFKEPRNRIGRLMPVFQSTPV